MCCTFTVTVITILYAYCILIGPRRRVGNRWTSLETGGLISPVGRINFGAINKHYEKRYCTLMSKVWDLPSFVRLLSHDQAVTVIRHDVKTRTGENRHI